MAGADCAKHKLLELQTMLTITVHQVMLFNHMIISYLMQNLSRNRIDICHAFAIFFSFDAVLLQLDGIAHINRSATQPSLPILQY